MGAENRVHYETTHYGYGMTPIRNHYASYEEAAKAWNELTVDYHAGAGQLRRVEVLAQGMNSPVQEEVA